MLKSYINTIPYTKFILIKDSVESKDGKLFEYMVKQHVNKKEHKLHYFVCEGVFKKAQQKYVNEPNIILYDYVTNSGGWMPENIQENFSDKLAKLGENDIVVIDALTNIIFQYGVTETYRSLNYLKNKKVIQQIIAVLHKDLIEGDENKTCMFFENLSTLCITVEPKFMSDNRRLHYLYKKSGGKIMQEIEEYRFEGDNLLTSKISKPSASSLLERSAQPNINPENLSTFKIGLTEKEKISRDKVILPYLPSANEKESEGQIIYQLDEMDDWDEEDPDDDLDI
ncbi:hypothetical protein GWI33_012994 [Rhynchophorus ferrugineus]|uniref:Elongator complex protein 5 n=1 Tax=Rhynchophorus ferrugineus TaxID=354439 RepID=A0A834I4A4_RHYFE|nr:hypothetical protein GWI33_012994 [Rhynchophorus ferrugineus]